MDWNEYCEAIKRARNERERKRYRRDKAYREKRQTKAREHYQAKVGKKK